MLECAILYQADACRDAIISLRLRLRYRSLQIFLDGHSLRQADACEICIRHRSCYTPLALAR
jgi:hypothetical protein